MQKARIPERNALTFLNKTQPFSTDTTFFSFWSLLTIFCFAPKLKQHSIYMKEEKKTLNFGNVFAEFS